MVVLLPMIELRTNLCKDYDMKLAQQACSIALDAEDKKKDEKKKAND